MDWMNRSLKPANKFFPPDAGMTVWLFQRVVSSLWPGITPEYSLGSEPQAFKESVLKNGLFCIVGTGWMKTAYPGCKSGKKLIDVDKENGNLFHLISALATKPFRASTIKQKSFSRTLFLATITRSMPFFENSNCWTASRICLFNRFLLTAFPRDFPVQIPILTSSILPGA